MEYEVGVGDLTKGESSFVSNIEVRVFSVEVHLNNWAVVLNSVVSIKVGSWSLGKHPSIINLEFRIGGVIGIGWTLNNQIPVIQEDILDVAVLHEGVFVDKKRLVDISPVDLVDAVFVRQRNDELILQVITEHTKSQKSEVSVSCSNGDSLGLQDVQSE